MDNWQAWTAAIFGFILSILSFSYQRDKKRSDEALKEFYAHRLVVMERITRIEAEIMTEREVREILQEFLIPFMASLQKIDSKTDTIQKDITDLKVCIASIPKRKQDNE
tara:strand:+ start:6479 stop:6805 length:327 start_codon:yes stop_codon:yes gene_type:complete